MNQPIPQVRSSPSSRFALRSSLALAVFLALSQIPAAEAGDILRGGTSAASQANAPTASSGKVTAVANKVVPTATDALARTTQALQAIQAMQSAARKAALTGPNNLGRNPNFPTQTLRNVPNGLAVGGLAVDPGKIWTGATLKPQTISGGKTNVTIAQSQSQALLYWKTFNVGKETQVTFDQSAGGKDASKWIAFNKIDDPSGSPTQILGSIKAQGQVYLINQNGILFGGSSQVNTHTLAASSLPINDNLIERGLLNNPDRQFLFSALTVPALDNGGTQPTFTPPISRLAGGKTGDIVVQRGAQIFSPTSADNVGGRIALIGANVKNEGTLSTPDGQTILAAGLQVGLSASIDKELRGLDVQIGQVTDPSSSLIPYAGGVINSGLIDVPRANVTLAGKDIGQNGVIHSTTSVSLNGSINLLANYNSRIQIIVGRTTLPATATGTVTLGPGSVSAILPELESTEKVVGNQLALQSKVEIQGRNIHLDNGSQIIAPSASVTIDAGSWLDNSGYAFVHDQGQIYLDRGARIDVAGTPNVEVPISQYIVEAQVRGAEVADSPLQRQGPFRGQTIYIDSRRTATFNGKQWIGTSLADVSGYVGLIQHSVGELTTEGGKVSLTAGGSVVLSNTSGIDVSGGSKNVLGGQVTTTRVLANGRLYDIADATPDQVYDGFYNGTFTQTFDKYGISNTFTNPLKLDGSHFEAGYVDGARAGSITIAAPTMALDGTLASHSITGALQRSETGLSGSLTVAFRGQSSTGTFLTIYPKPPTVTFQQNFSQPKVAAFSLDVNDNAADIGPAREKNVFLDPDLFGENGFGHLTIENNEGLVLVPTEVKIASGGSLTIDAANIDISGNIQAPGGQLLFKTHNVSQDVLNAIISAPDTPLPAPALNRGIFTLASAGSLSTAGLLVDDRLSLSPLPITISGGSISIQTYSAKLKSGSEIDVSGGAYISDKNKVTYGDGGSLEIKTGQDIRLGSVSGGTFVNQATLKGYSGASGGSLSLQAQLIRIGRNAPATTSASALWLNPDFFNQGGFGRFTLTGLGAIGDANDVIPALTIAANIRIEPVIESWRILPHTASDPQLAFGKIILAEGEHDPVRLTFSAPGIKNDLGSGLLVRGDLRVGAGVSITADPNSSVSFSGSTVEFLGSVFNPGGTINISGGTNTNALFQDPNHALATVYLGPRSLLSTTGTTLLKLDPYGRRFGNVLNGGNIAISGNIVAASGSRLDVSGAADYLDFFPGAAQPLETFAISARSGLTSPLVSLQTVSQRVESNAGSITLAGGQMLFSDATLLGKSGGPSAYGGSLIVSSSRFQGAGEISPLSPNLQVRQSGTTLPASFNAKGTVIGQPITLADSSDNTSLGHFSADDFQRGGFASLALNGVVEFVGTVRLQASGSLTVATGGLIYADKRVSLEASYVALGRTFTAPAPDEELTSPFFPLSVTPLGGSGELFVKAGLIDIGNLSLQGIGKTSLVAKNGDIRGDGTFQVTGKLSLQAGQIYPVTASQFSIIAYDGPTQPGTITISSSGTRSLPYSVGGTLGIYATNIIQGGVLRAPQGSIQLGWDGTGKPPVDLLAGNNVPFPITTSLQLGRHSITSVSAIDPLTGKTLVLPYGVIENGTIWIDPRGEDITLAGPPSKVINLSAKNIQLASGAQVDLRGGGDLYAYDWIKGGGGSTDALETTGSFAVIPDYDANYVPFAPFNPSTNPNNLLTDAGLGYTNNQLKIGDRIFLSTSRSLAAGYYTLLPARYALLDGAVLVTPTAGSPTGTIELPIGSNLVSGYRFNDIEGSSQVSTGATQFEVASSAVVRSRSEFADYIASSFFKANAAKNSLATPRLPGDGGQLVLQSTSSLVLKGMVMAQGGIGGRGGIVDISSPTDIFITGGGTNGNRGQLTLNATDLSHFGAESLLIGGIRSFTSKGTLVTTQTSNITVDNAGSPLTVADLILTANNNLVIDDRAVLASSGNLSSPLENLIFGNLTLPGSGNGAALRLSAQPQITISRLGVDTSTQPTFTIGAGVRISGASITLDSTYGTALDPTARLVGQSVFLNSGQISLQLDDTAVVQPTAGLVLSGTALQSLQKSKSLSLLSYSSIDIYGSGMVGSSSLGTLSLHAGEIRGFVPTNGTATFQARDIYLDNSANSTAPGAIILPQDATGTLALIGETLHLGTNIVQVDQFAELSLTGSRGIIFDANGQLASSSNVSIRTPLLTGASAKVYSINSQNGDLSIANQSGNNTDPDNIITAGLGANLTLQGRNITQSGNILLPSGRVILHATDGDINLAGSIDVSGVAKTFFDVIKTTGGGEIQLVSDTGDVSLVSSAVLNVSANSLHGDAGRLSVNAAQGNFSNAGKIFGTGADNGANGTFALDLASLSSSAYSVLQGKLQTGGFTEAQSFRLRTGDFTLNGLTTVNGFDLSTDAGSITVAGTIDASGKTGGKISLQASGSVTLLDGSVLTAAAQEFDNAGKGGSIYLSAGSERDGVIDSNALLDLQTGSQIKLGVAANQPDSASAHGQFTGTLHLRAPQTADNLDLLVNPINSNITGASSILVEGYRLFDLTITSGTITSAIQTAIRTSGTTFLGTAGTTTASYSAMQDRVFANNSGLLPVAIFAPGAEIIHRTGNLTLGTTSSTATSDWNLSTFRFGPQSAPGVLTLKAAGNLVFFNALSDGFLTSTRPLWQHLLLTQNTLLPANSQSWTYHLTAGTDFSAASYSDVVSAGTLASNVGHLLLGKNNGTNSSTTNSGPEATTNIALNNRYQVIRTGSGNIEVNTARSVRLLNQFASIYTAGTQVLDPTLGGSFDVPSLRQIVSEQGDLGSPQQSPAYRAQYSMAGGNVSLNAGENIEHLTLSAGELVADSQRELPTNWLYRRGYYDPVTGEFGQGSVGGIATTTWWVDFSNFFEGVGALGGGNVTLQAGNDISNVDAVVPTNMRLTKGLTTTSTAHELGGGNLTVSAGRNIDAGVYYVEKGSGTLTAGGSITTNQTRSPSLANLATPSDYYASSTWLPTTLFLGKGGFDVSALNNILLGPVANPFLLPGGFNNTFYFKTYFSTYASDSYVTANSVGGSVTLREAITLPTGTNQTNSTPILLAWLQNISLLRTGSASFYQPWLRLNETSVTPFQTAVSLLPPTLRVTAFSGNINLVGNLTLSPSSTGNVELLASGAINGLQPNGEISLSGSPTVTYGNSRINLSDADPSTIPGITTPYAYQSVVGTGPSQNGVTGLDFLLAFDALFDETGATQGEESVLQNRQTLHSPGLLHAGDSTPVRLYASQGDISGITLYSPKETRAFAGRDILDIAFYLQNLRTADTSIVSSGRDLIPYSSTTFLRTLANATGNIPNSDAGPLAGDIQIAGPGTLEVLAGRNLDLGIGGSPGDGTAAGITSIGNARNPYLPFAGADIFAGAGIGNSPDFAAFGDLDSSSLDFAAFIEKFLSPSALQADTYFEELALTADEFDKLSDEKQHQVALQAFYLILRDAGRNSSVAGSPDFQTYQSGFDAISALFPEGNRQGDISLTSRQIKTKNGGNVSLFAPGGKLTVGFDISGTQPLDQGILTEAGGNISIFVDQSVIVGTSRIFTLRGGNEIIWSSKGDIAAGASSKTVQSAPPTRVLVDPQSGDVQTDLAGLATGGGIGVLATVKTVLPGDVDLIAPTGTVDAGDAGIRVSGNLNIAAVQVLNADNIQASGTTVGTPVVVVNTPNLAGLTAASNTAATTNSATEDARKAHTSNQSAEDLPSIIFVEVLGYGG